MASYMRKSTPPPRAIVQVPPTPKHGYEDDYDPYTPRKSPRTRYQQRQQVRLAQTPPQQHRRTKPSSIGMTDSSPPESPQASTKKSTSRASNTTSGRYALNIDTASSTTTGSGLPTPTMHSKKEIEMQRSIMAARGDGMLPTPAKTPKKVPVEVSAGITSIARNLFPVRPETVEEVMPTPKRQGRKKYTGLTLESFEAHNEDDAPIQIFTDSTDRIPEVDRSSANPFYGQDNSSRAEPAKRTTRRSKISVPGEDEQDIDDVRQRDDGMITVFRGKKTFRKFAEDSDDDEDDAGLLNEIEAELGGDFTSRIDGPLTRSSVKPRLLFSSGLQHTRAKTRSQATEDEEEAITDIDEDFKFGSTPMEKAEDPIMTPKAPRFAPASPPTTARTTRTTDKLDKAKRVSFMDGADDSSDDGGDRVSPFDLWSRTKSTASAKGRKRQGESLERGKGYANKRSRV